MPDRQIKDSARSSMTLAKLSHISGRLWPLILTTTDNVGRFRADPAVVFSECAAMIAVYHPDVTLEVVVECLAELERSGLVALYRHEGRTFGHFPSFEEHNKLKRKTAKYPDPATCPDASGHASPPSISISTSTSSSEGGTGGGQPPAPPPRKRAGQLRKEQAGLDLVEPWARAMSAAFGGLVPGALDAPEVFLRLRDKYEVKPERQESLLKWLAAGSSDARFVRGWLTGDPGCLTRKKGKDDPRKLYLRLLERMDNDRSAKRAPVDVREAKPEDYSGGWGK